MNRRGWVAKSQMSYTVDRILGLLVIVDSTSDMSGSEGNRVLGFDSDIKSEVDLSTTPASYLIRPTPNA